MSVHPPAGRVLQVVLSLHPGGTERLVVELVRRLAPIVPMAVCCLDEQGDWGLALARDGFDVRALHRRPGFHPTLGRAVADAAARHHATVLHCHHYSPFVYGALARFWRRDLRTVFTEHGRLSDAPPSKKRRIANLLLTRTHCQVMAVSAHLRDHMVAEGFPDAKVRVLYNGIDVGQPQTVKDRQRVRGVLGVQDDEVLVGTVARLDPVKDLTTMIQAIRQLGDSSPIRLLVIGDGTEREALETAARGASVRFLGHRDDARDLLAGCDFYANSSIHEGISLTILEAMAAALPVVATSVGGTPEIFDDSCGRLVPARNPSAMAAAFRELALDPALRLRLGTAARRRVEERFTIERMVEEYRQAYLRAV